MQKDESLTLFGAEPKAVKVESFNIHYNKEENKMEGWSICYAEQDAAGQSTIKTQNVRIEKGEFNNRIIFDDYSMPFKDTKTNQIKYIKSAEGHLNDNCQIDGITMDVYENNPSETKRIKYSTIEPRFNLSDTSQPKGDGCGGMYEDQLVNKMVQSMANAGITLLNDDACGKLLAIMYVYASHSEAFLFTKKLQRDWRFAQYRFKIVGGETPRAETLPIFQKYARIYGADYDKNIINQDAQDFMKKRYGLEIII